MKKFVMRLTLLVIFGALGGIAGVVGGFYLYTYIFPPWARYELPKVPTAANAIVKINIEQTLEDPKHDVVYVRAQSGEAYSLEVLQGIWQLVEEIPPDPHQGAFSECASAWKDHPPLWGSVADSKGIRFERPLSTILRCYVLYSDGGFEVWTRETDVGGLLISLVGGGVLGFGLVAALGLRITKRFWEGNVQARHLHMKLDKIERQRQLGLLDFVPRCQRGEGATSKPPLPFGHLTPNALLQQR